MHNVQIIIAQNKQTNYQPPFPQKKLNKKNSTTNKDWKQKFSPSKPGFKNSNLDNSSTLNTCKKLRGGGGGGEF